MISQGIRFFAILAVCVCVSCVENIDFDDEFQDKIVVNCVLTDNDVQYLDLTHNGPLGSTTFEPVRNAFVTLSSEGEVIGEFKYTGRKERWALEFTPEAGKTYRLTVLIDGFKTITAETTMPETPRVMKKGRADNTAFRKWFSQDPMKDTYWVFSLLKTYDDGMYDATEYDRLDMTLGTSHPDVDNFNANDRLMFYDTHFEEEGTTIEHFHYLRISPKSISPVTFCVEGSFQERFFVVFRGVSEEYDRYLKTSVLKMMVYYEEDGPIVWLEDNIVYSNINNGLGIFGAYSDWVIPFSPELPE